MKVTAEELFAAFSFKRGDCVVSKANPAVRYTVIQRLLPEGKKWSPIYLLTHIRDDGTGLVAMLNEIELERT